MLSMLTTYASWTLKCNGTWTRLHILARDILNVALSENSIDQLDAAGLKSAWGKSKMADAFLSQSCNRVSGVNRRSGKQKLLPMT